MEKHELELELGQGANPAEIDRQADLISDKWHIPETRPKNPLLLMLGGFQGSGKTTVLDILAPEAGLIIVSPDEIRHNLFAEHYPFSDESIKLVNATKIELVNRTLAIGYSSVIDASITPDRVKLTQKLLEKHPNYRFLSVFLSAPRDVLAQRVLQRPQLPGMYRGTVSELEASMDRYAARYGDPQEGGYDLIIDPSANDPQAIVSIIKARL